MRHYFDCLIDVVKDNIGGEKHEASFRHARDRVVKRCGGSGDGLKVVDSIVSNKANGTSSESRDFRDLGESIGLKLLLQSFQRIALDFFSRASLDGFERVLQVCQSKCWANYVDKLTRTDETISGQAFSTNNTLQ